MWLVIAPWHGPGEEVSGIRDAGEDELWTKRTEGEHGKELRWMIKKYLTEPVVKKVRNGLLVLTDAWPHSYSDSYVKSKIQRQLDAANKQILFGEVG